MVNFNNIDEYLKDHPSGNECGHVVNNIDRNLFVELGHLYDESIGTLSYLILRSENTLEEFVGTYPLQNCQVLQCRLCGQTVFIHMNDAGIAPRLEYFLAEYHKDYLTEPAVRSVYLDLGKYASFVNAFKLSYQNKNKNFGFESVITIADKTQYYLFNYREYDGQHGRMVYFDLVGSRQFLRRVHWWLLEHKGVS